MNYGPDYLNNNVYIYSPDAELPDLSNFINNSIEIRIEKSFITWKNPNVIKRKLWGSDNYTSNSDAVCILLHSSLITTDDLKRDKVDGVLLICHVSKAKRSYSSSERNGILSRKHPNTVPFYGHTLKVQNVKLSQNFESEEMNVLIKLASKMAVPKREKKKKVMNYDLISPIFCNHITFNLNNEPAFAYSLENISDKGEDQKSWLTYRLKSQVLYLETEEGRRIEISKHQNEHQMIFGDYNSFRIAEVKDPWSMDCDKIQNENIPLRDTYVKILFQDLEWDLIKWGLDSVEFGSLEIGNIINFKFFPVKIIANADIISLD